MPKGLDTDKLLIKDYHYALQAYWGGRNRTSLETLSNALANLQEPSVNQLKLYRLWIELLAQEHDTKALCELNEHLSYLICQGHALASSLNALSGIIYMELDQLEAAQLVYETDNKIKTNPYIWELHIKLHTRGLLPDHQKAIKPSVKLSDYFHYTAHAQSLLSQNQRSDFTSVCQQLNKHYPENPFTLLAAFHSHVDEKHFSQALSYAEQLITAYPLHLDYGFAYAWALCKCKHFAEASHYLNRLQEIHPDPDLDRLSWWAYALLESEHKPEQHEDVINAATELLEKALSQAESTGYPPYFIKHMLYQSLSDQNRNSTPRYWLLRISAKHFYQLRSGDLNSIQYIQTKLNPHAQAGDYCFICSEEAHNPLKRWRFGALYQVTAAPSHQATFYKHHLKLLDKPEIAIPIDVEHIDQHSHTPLKSFEMELQALDTFIAQIEDYLDTPHQHIYQQLRATS